ncbi:TolC family protein [Erythrobacter sp. EC-HK427]|uniref:TolC family protein n=1 Tax=Erythrobacter sp. EC-HK427 TaxID=2038396 RepID=UPI001251C8BA|nr:TolC family protein [Erythrobacter sp. EC-HK427]VVT20734.1 Transporter [Erythrobacter sp. EC-HK427]
MIRARILAATAMLAALSGCISLAPEPEVPVVTAELPEQYLYVENAGEYRPEAWWTAFDDPVLDTLVARALESNLDIAEAAARVEQASAQARLARSALLPTVVFNRDTTSSSTPLSGSPFGGIAGGGGPDRIENDTFSFGVGAAYELDLFGRARNDLAATRADALAVEQNFRSVQLAVAAETISAYFDVVDTRRQIELTVASLDVLQDRAARTQERFARGLAQSFELYQIEQELRAAQAALPQLESALSAHEGRLAILLGTYRPEVESILSAPLIPTLVFDAVPVGLPSDLLAQRPDVAAAWARLEAARLRIGARRAERYPQPSLVASFGSQGGGVGSALNIFDNWAASFALSMVAPIFDGGRISANIEAARAVYAQNAAAYTRSVITAFAEVDTALSDYEEQRQRYLLIAAQLTEAQSSLDLQRRRFAAGVGSYTAYLDALRNVYQVESSLSGAARATALSRLNVHRALGGDWAPDSQPLPLEMRPLADGPAGDVMP